MNAPAPGQSAPRAAVLLLAFNRPETTARVFEAIRRSRPPRLYVAVDGPRASRPGEAERCAEVRRMVSAVDWPCRLQTLFREENLGCKRGVSTAIDWFFSQEERGIVLEDDCLPSQSFFRFCEELLERLQDDPRVFAIQGNFFGSARPLASSYVFSKMFYMWGWASWADRWRAVRIDAIDEGALRRALAEDAWLGRDALKRDYWLDVARLQAAGQIDSWGYPAQFHCFARTLFNATPTTNLVVNIGAGPSATQTAVLNTGPHHGAALEVDFPLSHGSKYEGADDMLAWEYRWRVQLTAWKLIRQVLHYRHPKIYEAARALVRPFRTGRQRAHK